MISDFLGVSADSLIQNPLLLMRLNKEVFAGVPASTEGFSALGSRRGSIMFSCLKNYVLLILIFWKILLVTDTRSITFKKCIISLNEQKRQDKAQELHTHVSIWLVARRDFSVELNFRFLK
jgi:hypothetical protein